MIPGFKITTPSEQQLIHKEVFVNNHNGKEVLAIKDEVANKIFHTPKWKDYFIKASIILSNRTKFTYCL